MNQQNLETNRAAYRAYRILQAAFVIVPIVVGIDKFFHVLVNWDQYLSPAALHVLGRYSHAFMRVAGVAEICVGIGMIFRPRIFAYIASAWIFSIFVNLLLTGAFFDVALRDFVLVLATLALGPLSEAFSKRAPKQEPEHVSEREPVRLEPRPRRQAGARS